MASFGYVKIKHHHLITNFSNRNGRSLYLNVDFVADVVVVVAGIDAGRGSDVFDFDSEFELNGFEEKKPFFGSSLIFGPNHF